MIWSKVVHLHHISLLGADLDAVQVKHLTEDEIVETVLVRPSRPSRNLRRFR